MEPAPEPKRKRPRPKKSRRPTEKKRKVIAHDPWAPAEEEVALAEPPNPDTPEEQEALGPVGGAYSLAPPGSKPAPPGGTSKGAGDKKKPAAEQELWAPVDADSPLLMPVMPDSPEDQDELGPVYETYALAPDPKPDPPTEVPMAIFVEGGAVFGVAPPPPSPPPAAPPAQGSDVEEAEYTVAPPVEVAAQPETATREVSKIEEELAKPRREVPLPPRPLQEGIFQFPFYPTSAQALAYLTIAFILILFLLRAQMAAFPNSWRS